MDIVVLNYPTGEVDVIRGIDEDLIEAKYEGNVGEYLYDCGYREDEVSFMCVDKFKLNTIKPEEL